MALFDGVNTESYVKTSFAEMRRSFQQWTQRMLAVRRKLNPQPTGVPPNERFQGIDQFPRLQLYNAQWTQFTSADLRLFHRMFKGRMLRNAPPQFRGAVTSGNPDDLERFEKLERFCYGVLNLLNHEVSSTGAGTSWLSNLVDMIACPGKVICLPQVRETFPGSGQATVTADLWDPLTVYHDFTWPMRYVHEYRTGALNAYKKLREMGLPWPASVRNKPDANTDAPVTFGEFWVESPDGKGGMEVYRAILINGELAGDVWKSKALHLPLVNVAVHATTATYQVAGLVGPSAVMGSRGMTMDALLYHAEPFYAPLVHTDEEWEQTVSMAINGFAKRLDPAILVMSKDGAMKLPIGAEQPGSITRVDADMLVKKLIEDVSQEAGVAFDKLQAIFVDEKNKLVNPALFGQSSPGDSGFLDASKASHAMATFQESVEGCQIAVTNVMMEIIHQFREQPGLEMKLSGSTPRGYAARQFFSMSGFKASDLPERDGYVLVTAWEPDLPVNNMQKLSEFLQGQGKGFSQTHGMVNILGIPEPIAMLREMDRDAVHQSPQAQAVRVLVGMRHEAEALLAAAAQVNDPAGRRRAMREARIAEGFYEKMEQQLMGQSQGQGSQEQPPGTPPEAMPPELGGENPDQMALAAGEQSSYAGGPGPGRLSDQAGA